jgi:hypothetical protein
MIDRQPPPKDVYIATTVPRAYVGETDGRYISGLMMEFLLGDKQSETVWLMTFEADNREDALQEIADWCEESLIDIRKEIVRIR